jgi:hypothetical protein
MSKEELENEMEAILDESPVIFPDEQMSSAQLASAYTDLRTRMEDLLEKSRLG